jgi:hypothetical protein
MVKTRFEELDIPDTKLVPILVAWVAALFLVPIAGAIFHVEILVTQVTIPLLGGLLIGLIWRWSRPKGMV